MALLTTKCALSSALNHKIVPSSKLSCPFSLKLIQGRQRQSQGRHASFSVVVNSSTSPDNPSSSPSPPSRLLEAQAWRRLQKLLSGIGDGEEELAKQLLEQEPPQSKVFMAVIASSCIATVAQLLCWLGGADPWGGASLSLHSLKAAGVGALASIPLVLLNYYLWTSPKAAEQLPFLEEVQSKQLEDFGPMIDGLSPLQLQAFMVAETLPGVLMTYCAGAGLIAHLIHTAVDFAVNGGTGGFGDLGELASAASVSSSSSSSILSSLPPLAPEAVGLAVAASLAGVARGSEIAASEEEYEVIRDAIENSEKYYRVVAMGKDSTVVDASEASTTFITVAIRWMVRFSRLMIAGAN